MNDFKHFKLILKYLKNDKLKIFLYVIFSILLNVLPLVISIVSAYTLDSLTSNKQLSFIFFLVILYLSNVLTWSICNVILELLYNKLENNFVKNEIKIFFQVKL